MIVFVKSYSMYIDIQVHLFKMGSSEFHLPGWSLRRVSAHIMIVIVKSYYMYIQVHVSKGAL